MIVGRPQTRAFNERVACRGTALAELVVLLPVLLVVMLTAVDFGRMVYAHQVLVDLTRESANLVSRGATTEEAIAAVFSTKGEIDVENKGGIIISEVRRRDADDDTPWIFSRTRRGAMGNFVSKIGEANGPANIPDVPTLAPGVTIMAVEIIHAFDPIFSVPQLGIDFYPRVLYDAAFF